MNPLFSNQDQLETDDDDDDDLPIPWKEWKAKAREVNPQSPTS